MIPDYAPSSLHVKKETLGQQWLSVQEKYAGQKTQTVRETTDEMGKEYMDSLWSLVEMHSHIQGLYYIQEIIQPDPFLEGVIKVKHIARRSRPNPEWGIALYSVNNKTCELTYEWGLPNEAEAMIMMSNPEGWDRKVVQDIKDFHQGNLK